MPESESLVNKSSAPSSSNTGNPNSGEPDVELYGANYYATYASGHNIAYDRSDTWLSFFSELAQRITKELEPTSALDVGCAWGFLVEGLRDCGVDARGSDISTYAISKAGGSAAGHCSVASATDPIEGRYDLITTIEMIEHLSPEDGRIALERMTAASDRILLSTTPFDYDEATHLNVQPPEYWAQILADLGFYRDLDYDASYLSRWAGLFVKGTPTKRALVHNYERSEWRYRIEALTLRDQVVLLSSDDPTASSGILKQLGEVTEQSEVAQERVAMFQQRAAKAEADLRLARDAAAGAEASQGTLAAQVTELQERLAAVLSEQAEWHQVAVGRSGSEAQLELDAVKASRSWRLIWGVLAPYRALRGRR